MSNPQPLVSVVLPCFQAERHLLEALESLTGQTYRHLEIIALDDGSTDGTRAILEEMARSDPRVKVVVHSANQGLVATLNRGVAEARGTFIARMDADDRSHPRRIELQVDALRREPELGVVSVGIRHMSHDGSGCRRHPIRASTPYGARFMAHFAMPLAHAGILARASILKAHPYSQEPQALHTEDYELVTRMIRAGVQVATLPRYLYDVRIHGGSVSRRYEAVQVANFVACARRHLEAATELRPSAPGHRVFVNRMDGSEETADLREGLGLLDRIEAGKGRASKEGVREVRALVAQQRLDILIQAARRGSPEVRAAVPREALRYLGELMSPAALGYLMTKLRRTAPAR